MNKLWIYGCSFSDSMGDKKESWWNMLSEKLNLECINRSQAGYGWSFHQNLFYSDCNLWNIDDIIILENSFLTRMYTPFLIEKFEKIKLIQPTSDFPLDDNDELYLENLINITSSIKNIIVSNYTSFYNSLQIINKIHKKWFFWSVNGLNAEYFYGGKTTYLSSVPQLNERWVYDNKKTECDVYEIFSKNKLVFDNIIYYDDWMRKNPNYCVLPPDDLHQNKLCHSIQCELFFKQISDFLNG